MFLSSHGTHVVVNIFVRAEFAQDPKFVKAGEVGATDTGASQFASHVVAKYRSRSAVCRIDLHRGNYRELYSS